MRLNGKHAVTVLIAGELAAHGHNLDLPEIQARTRAADPATRVAIVPDLRNRFEDVFPAVAAGGDARAVLCLETGDYPTATLQLEARKAGLDPLGIAVVNFGAYPVKGCPDNDVTEWATTVVLGGIARARAFAGSQPESLRPFVPKQLSRRALFSLPVLEYRAMPTIQRSRCRAGEGCLQCQRTCPHGAVSIVDGFPELDKTQCTSCGRCVTACPQEAIDIPGATVDQLNVQMTAMLGDASARGERPHGILFHCHNGARTLERLASEHNLSLAPNWLPIEVPCIGMVKSHWLLAPLTLGAAAVRVLPCGNGCRSGEREIVDGEARYAQEILWLLGETGDRVAVLPSNGKELVSALGDFPAIDRDEAVAQAPDTSVAHHWRTSVLLRLADNYQADRSLTLDHPQSPFGVVTATEGCTLCGACARACPTRALILKETDTRSELTFDSTLCVGCEQCLAACPEVCVLDMRRATDLPALAASRIVLREDAYKRCESCGKPIASTAMSRRVAALLGDEFVTTVNVISRYCVDCRGMLS